MNPGDVVALTPVELTGFIGDSPWSTYNGLGVVYLVLGVMYLVLFVVFSVVVFRRKSDFSLRAYHTWNPRLRTAVKRAGYTLLWSILVLWVYGLFLHMGSRSESSYLFLNIVSILGLSVLLVYAVILVL